ncbi:MAG: DNA helicase UvrBC, partial [Planctomycetota bacterium]|nr:DNA helicase UvrBC [Planctomycetota bacterium]
MGKNETDISKILQDWKYGDDDHVRRVTTASGDEVLQVRLPLGIEQYELEGRPDGLRPQGEESWFHHYSSQAEKNPWN